MKFLQILAMILSLLAGAADSARYSNQMARRLSKSGYGSDASDTKGAKGRSASDASDTKGTKGGSASDASDTKGAKGAKGGSASDASL
jgi:hypothetical protein